MTGTTLTLERKAKGRARKTPAAIRSLVIAGWTGRDAEAMEAHIRELEALGIARPKTTPIFYRVAASLLTTAPEIEVAGGDSSGEVETVIFALDDGLWVGVGSDHTDRKVETVGVTLSKQMCAKPVAGTVWRFDDVADHWDRLVLRSYAIDGKKRRLYQEGPVTRMRPPRELLRSISARASACPRAPRCSAARSRSSVTSRRPTPSRSSSKTRCCAARSATAMRSSGCRSKGRDRGCELGESQCASPSRLSPLPSPLSLGRGERGERRKVR